MSVMLREVKTENGWVRGIPAADPRITAFKGIPYAAPATGNNRWREPQPAEDWEGVKECYTFGPIAMQRLNGLDPEKNLYDREWHVDPEIEQSEDCLQLNIWTNAKTGKEKMPVILWFYGGGLQEGHPSEMEFDGERIARRGVILVSANYRVNVFGFLAHPELTKEAGEKGARTNFGLYDQHYALKWVKRNIEAFGGDPDNITISGQSAGGRSVLFQLCSPLNDTDHIKRGISISGGGINYLSMMAYMKLEEAEKRGEEFFEFMGVKTLEEARKLDGEFVRQKMIEFGHGKFGAVVDYRFMPEDPADMLAENKRLQVPVMAGSTTGDMFDLLAKKNTKEEFRDAIIKICGEKAADEVLAFDDWEDKDIDQLKEDFKINSQRFGVELLHMRACDAGLDSYFYEFGPEVPGWDDPGAFHSSDLWFIFETLAKCWRPWKGKHYDLARQICNYHCNFAKNGDPNGKDADGSDMPRWEKFSNDAPYSIFFGDKAEMKTKDERPAVKKLLELTAAYRWRDKK